VERLLEISSDYVIAEQAQPGPEPEPVQGPEPVRGPEQEPVPGQEGPVQEQGPELRAWEPARPEQELPAPWRPERSGHPRHPEPSG